MENQDLRKGVIDTARSINEELKGAIVLVAGEHRAASYLEGNTDTLVTLLASAVMDDPKILTLIRAAMKTIESKIINDIMASKLN